MYYSGVSQIRSEISPALQNISEAHIDSAKLDSQRLEQAIRENETDTWYIENLKTFIDYRTAQSTYYKAIFDEVREIDTSVSVATNAIHTHDQFFGLAFSNLYYPLSIMAITGVIIPMVLLGLGENIDARGSRWIQSRRILTAVCIIAFCASTMWIISVIWQQFSVLYLV